MISKFSVKKPYTVLVGVVLAIVLGVVSFTKMTADLLPNISLPYIIVMTTYPGADPETVEMVVTQPLEAGMATVSNIEGISSVSAENYSMVILEFAQSADMNAVSLEIRESLDQIKSYWDDSVGNPIMIKLNPDMLPVMIAAVGVDGMDHADISTYVQEEVAPELESIEGVASVSATGLLEESVNVIIRKEKVDAINEKVFAAIDEKMADAAKELEDGRKALEDSIREMADGKQEIAEGRLELLEGEKELAEGKQQLEDNRDAAIAKLATTKKDLLTAKINLEAAKMDMTSSLTMMKQLAGMLEDMEGIGGGSLPEGWEEWLPGGGSQGGTEGDSTEGGSQNGDENVSDGDGNQDSGENVPGGDDTQDGGENAPGGDDTQDGGEDTTEDDGTGEGSDTGVTDDRDEIMDWIESITGDMSMEGYEQTVNAAIASIDKNLATVNYALIEVEKGELTAALEFANASLQIALGEQQMELAKAQLDAAWEQIKSGEEQLENAKEQLEEGEKQFADAKDSAYEQADMQGILTVDTVKGLLTAQNFSMPAGYVTEDGVDYLVRIGDKPSTVDDLKALPLMDLHMDDVPVITLDDVADVFYTDNSASIYTNVNGSPGVMLTIQKQTGYSTGEVSDLLLERFDNMMVQNEALNIITLMDQGIYIDLVMDSIISNIIWGGLLAILILVVFLKDLRPTFVIALSIPISLVTAIVCMYFSGVTLNVISLSGLALGIGMLVDNSIVVIENIYRLRGDGYSMKEAAIEGSREVAGAIAASTLTTICVFLPIVFTEGITRQLFVDMGLTIAYSLIASLVIALTVVPAMSSKMLTRTKEQKESRFYLGMLKGYEKLLQGALKVKPLVYILVVLLLVGSILAAWTNGTAFMSEMDSTQLTVSINTAEDATLAETAEVTDEVVAAIMEIEDVEDVGAMVNSSTMSMLGGGSDGVTNATTVYVVTSEEKKMSNEEIAALILDKTKDFEAKISVETSNMDMSALGGSGISIQVRGRDIDTLQKIAGEVAAIVESVEGTTNVQDGLEDANEELRIVIDRDKAISYGLTVAQVFTQIAPKLAEASSATTLAADNKDYTVYVANGEDSELTRELVKEIEVTGTDKDGKNVKILLSEIAEFETAYSLPSINRAEQNRYISVSARIADGYNVGLVSTDVEEKLESYEVPEGYKLVFSGENETINDALGQVALMLLLAIVFMYLIMVAQFQSMMSPFIIMFTIPLAFTGGFWGLFVSGSEISVIAMVGFVMLSGVIVNNGIVLIDYMNQLRERGMERREAILTAGRTRLRPVLMTALTTILALSTMVFSNDMGAEMAKPMSVVTIGGLLYGTLLTLVVIPCVYDNFTGVMDKWKTRKKKDELCEKNV